MVSVVQCPSCGAPLQPGVAACVYCKVVLSWPGAPAAASPAALEGVAPGVVELLRKGDKIGAIKAHHTATKCKLVEAKDAVEKVERALGLGGGSR